MSAVASERRRHLANVIAIAKAFANWTETLPSSKSRDTKKLGQISKICSIQKLRYCSVVSESVVICQLTLKMAEEIDFENWRISNFKGLVTLTLDRVIRHTIVHQSSTSTYTPNFIGIGKTFCGRIDVRMDVRTDGRLTHVIRSTLRSLPKNYWIKMGLKTIKNALPFRSTISEMHSKINQEMHCMTTQYTNYVCQLPVRYRRLACLSLSLSTSLMN